jgi:hypothetical protein
VSFDSRKTARLGPSTIAVHDDGDVPGNRFHRGHGYKIIVSPRAGPTLTIDNLAPVSAEIYLT